MHELKPKLSGPDGITAAHPEANTPVAILAAKLLAKLRTTNWTLDSAGKTLTRSEAIENAVRILDISAEIDSQKVAKIIFPNASDEELELASSATITDSRLVEIATRLAELQINKT